MPQTVKGVIARSKGADVELVDIVVPDPGPGEAVVQVQSCGVCHTDLHYREGGINDEFPFLLGPRGRGSRRGGRRGRDRRAPGDFVILNWRAVCGQCRACAKGKPWYCFNTHNATQKMTLDRRHRAQPGARHRGASSRRPWSPPASAPRSTAERRRGRGGPARVRRDGRLRRGASTPADVGRGDSMAVIGCGGVGQRARSPGPAIAGATTIIAVDVDDRKLERARAFGATHTVNGEDEDVVERIKELTGGFGADVVVEAVGRPETYEQAFYARDLAGTVVLVGVPTPDKQVDAADDRDLRSRRRARSRAGTATACPAATSRCWSTSTARAGSTSTPSCRSGSGSTTSRPRSTRWSAARCCARSWCSDG